MEEGKAHKGASDFELLKKQYRAERIRFDGVNDCCTKGATKLSGRLAHLDFKWGLVKEAGEISEAAETAFAKDLFKGLR